MFHVLLDLFEPLVISGSSPFSSLSNIKRSIQSKSYIFFFKPPLLILQCDENATFSNQGLYLSLPCCKEDFNSCPNLPANLPFQRSPKETFWVSTILCSTKLTQNGNLTLYRPLLCMQSWMIQFN